MSDSTKMVGLHDVEGDSPLEKFLKLYAKAQRQYNKLQLLNTQRTAEMAKYLDNLRFTQETAAGILKTWTTEARKRGPDDSGVESFKNLDQQLHDDVTSTREQSRAVMDIDSQAGTMQYQLANIESEMVTALGEYLSTLPGCKHLLERMHNLPSERPSTPSDRSEEIPEQVQAYFDAVGESSILRECISDLTFTYDEEREQRDFRRDQEIEPSTPDSIFESRHSKAHEKLVEDLAQKLKTVEDTRGLCEDLGMDPDSFRRREASFVPEHRFPTAFDVRPNWPGRSTLDEGMLNAERLEGWLASTTDVDSSEEASRKK
ncbi:hypothetical protein M409DRAFT_61400 [Zasmidium cellare ATCC 36951]|uniref:Uncharacterized protein n=1 Tax=Zasmidium cellare ATCC 36951 TaxID=1080233 RepID=A0A6A6BVE8_ZASCE|nr:uncharacterized protein M409DRAFT_61400 [Zasmidium cellare ATCC 36951]KAF2158741.1 hypothetical protein M409DRAFT_61400 [Zasmidium cellare ATCC 36951]